MKRREFIAFIGGAAVWPSVAFALEPGSQPRIGFLGPTSPSVWNSFVAAFLQRMRELTELKRTGPLVDVILADHALFHLEADLRWIDLTSERLDELAKVIRAR